MIQIKWDKLNYPIVIVIPEDYWYTEFKNQFKYINAK